MQGTPPKHTTADISDLRQFLEPVINFLSQINTGGSAKVDARQALLSSQICEFGNVYAQDCALFARSALGL